MSHNYIKTVAKHLTGKKVEVYCGDVKTVLLQVDAEFHHKSTIRGVIVSIEGDCLILECESAVGSTRVFINSWAIKTIIPWEDSLFTASVFIDEEKGLPKPKAK